MEDAANGRQERAMRGWNACLSGCSSESGYFWPVSVPTGLRATTGVSAANPGTISRFTRRPYNSVIGEPYSQRTPKFTVRLGLILQSSVIKASSFQARKYLSALPKAMELVSGMPSRNPARSEPVPGTGAPFEVADVDAPVKVKVPRGS